MARPTKQGLDYFSFDVDFFDDEKIVAISDEYGCKGEVIIIRLLCAIYRNGAYIEFSSLLARVVAKKAGVSAGLVNSIVDRAVLYGLFDKSMFDQYRILTSKGIQNRYFEAKKKWQHSYIPEQFLIVDKPHEKGVAEVFVKKTPEKEDSLQKNLCQTEVFCKKTPQRKGKERKEKKSINNNTSNQESNLNIIPTAIGAEQMNLPHASGEIGESQEDFQLQGDCEQAPIEQPQLSGFKIILSDGTFYEVTVAELEEWRKLYPGVNIEQELRNMQGWSDSHQRQRKTRKGVRSFITNWLTKEQDRSGSRAGYGLPPIRRNGEPVPTSKREIGNPSNEDCPF